ncbi:PIN domain-containing protein [Desulfonema limicola]|uniref:PIN domain-containing protein n=1 Tax=Desulfonema limicola TaxID=45656 RepID=A0A975B5M0_9BACT|nr:type II toxin-antitoxin system VapC family toxin [Desulfonema limicola]QTA79218.1 PIN domain-containing protein [Desulfonema limicola]
MYLFDTDVITNILKKKPSQTLLNRLKNIRQEDQFITVITVAEIVYGAEKSRQPEYHLKNLEAILLPAVSVLDFDIKAAYIAGNIRAGLEKAGMRLAWADIQIAAIAMSHEITLITGNIKHFARVAGLKIENWLID